MLQAPDATIFGGAGADYLFALGANDFIDGGADNDFISLGGGTDLGQGGAGDDTLNGGTGLDTLDGGSGVDVADYSDRSGGVNVEIASGIAKTGGSLNAEGFYEGGFTEDTLISIENVVGSEFADRLVGGGASPVIDGLGGDDRISGLTGFDLLRGGAGDDTIDASNSFDTLEGGAGDDFLDGGTGFDTLDGGAGDDTADYSNRSGGVNVVLAAGSQFAKTGGFLNSGGFYQGGFTEDTLISIENAIGSEFADRLIGGGASPVIDGLGGDDNIFRVDGL